MTSREARGRFCKNRREFLTFYNAIETLHASPRGERARVEGHGFSHDLAVAQNCVRIAPDERSGNLAWCAAFIHSFDHLFATELREQQFTLESQMEGYLWFLRDAVSASESMAILHAAVFHKTANLPDDGMVKIILQDADRMTNVMRNVVIRATQFHPGLPDIEMQYLDTPNPASTYRDPQSVRDDLIRCLEWEDDPRFGLRLPRAKELAAPYFKRLREYLGGIREEFEELGLHPWPIPEDQNAI